MKCQCWEVYKNVENILKLKFVMRISLPFVVQRFVFKVQVSFKFFLRFK